MSKVILVTGASSGIGKCCAEHLAKKGFIVYGTSRKLQFSEIENLHFLEVDVTKPETIKVGVEKLIAEQGKIDVLINNAGMGIGGVLELTTESEMRLQIETNFMGTVNVCSAVIPYFREQKHGKIINLSSIGGVMGLPYQGMYSASKFAIEGYSEALSLELHRFNIKVTLVEPGDFNTGFTAGRIISQASKEHPDYEKSFTKTLAIIEKEELGGGNPEKIAKLMEKIVRKKNPRFRYTIGNFIQVLFVYLKRVIPYSWSQAILRDYYKL